MNGPAAIQPTAPPARDGDEPATPDGGSPRAAATPAHRLPATSGTTPLGTTPVGTRRNTLAAETRRLYASDWSGFAGFCAAAGTRALPADPATVAAFLSLPGPGAAARTRRLAAIDHRHGQHGLPRPGEDVSVRQALRQARKAAPSHARPPPPSAAALRAMAVHCARDLAGRRDRALLLLLAAGLSRAAVVGLQAERLRFAEHGLQLGERGTTAATVLPRDPSHDRCPVRALEAWLHASTTRYGPVFRKVTRWNTVEPQALGADAVRRILARRRP